ncbi:MAG: hypothetical protein GY707_16930 [Desulfobacteraceae bacterium]|nr:hypothetical protein [Desulfobacteraceae bacterium]
MTIDIEIIHQRLSKLVLKNLKKNNVLSPETHIFDDSKTIQYNIQNYPIELLLNIDEDEDFIRECHFKILNRYVSPLQYDSLLQKLRSKQYTRMQFIEELSNSLERKRSHTGLNDSQIKI